MIKFIRSFFCVLCFFIFGLGGLVIGFVIFPVALLVRNSKKQQRFLVNAVHISWRAFVRLMCVLRLIKIKCPEYKKLKSLRGTIVIANHPSLIDVVILVSCIPNSVCVVKDSLFKNIFVRKIVGKIYLSNTMLPDEFIACGTEILSKGYNIVVFPEGTRTIPNKEIHFHRGFAYLQIATKAKILPIKIINTPPVLGKKQKWWDVGKKTSVYNIVPMPYIHYAGGEKQSKRAVAFDITEKAKTVLF
ncbi:MAG: 1-acyl-sn-glycerol-3-phosphate acyltransferase [Alphaproteobacteria bacterium]|nr:1-acyl-sn-glycerol-3-phosphate acyltransferase [Alphaproteobacteria bacterium]